MAGDAWIAVAAATTWLPFLALVSIYTWTTRSSRHSDFTLWPRRSKPPRRSDRSRRSSLSLQTRESLQIQRISIRTDDQTWFTFIPLQTITRRSWISSVPLWTHWTRESSLARQTGPSLRTNTADNPASIV